MLVDEVGEEWGDDVDGADEAAQVGGGAKCVGEIIQKERADAVMQAGCCVYGDAFYVDDEVVVSCEGGEWRGDVRVAFCLANRVFYTSVERWKCTCEKSATNEGAGDEISAVELTENQFEHVQIHPRHDQVT